MTSSDESTPAVIPATAAATVVVLRDGAHGPEVLLQRRLPTLPDFGGLWAFPGGKVEPADRAYAAWLLSQAPPAVAEDLFAPLGEVGVLESAPAGARLAAIREAFEETGLLYAEGWTALSVERFQRHREDWRVAIARDATAFEALMSAEGLRPATHALHYWSRWLPPLDLPRRFETDFFVALAPDAQEPLPDLTEASDVRWVPLAQVDSPDLPCPPVTRIALLDLRRRYAACGSLAAVIHHVRDTPVLTIQTVRAVLDGVAYVLFPWDAAYTAPSEPAAWTDSECAMMADLPSRLPITD